MISFLAEMKISKLEISNFITISFCLSLSLSLSLSIPKIVV